MELFISVRRGFAITLKCLNEDGIFSYKKCSKSAGNYEPDAETALLNSPAYAFHQFLDWLILTVLLSSTIWEPMTNQG